ncbi:MAG: antitoxin [Desulfobacterales bacterium]
MESVERGEWIRTADFDKEKKKAEAVAKATFAGTEKINIRISKQDIVRLKNRALEQGIPYEILVSSIIHNYLEEQQIK